MFGFLFKNKKKSAVNLEELTQELQDETDKINDEMKKAFGKQFDEIQKGKVKLIDGKTGEEISKEQFSERGFDDNMKMVSTEAGKLNYWTDIVDFIIKGGNPNAIDENGNTFLHRFPKWTSELFKYGVSLSNAGVKNNAGYIPLARTGHVHPVLVAATPKEYLNEVWPNGTTIMTEYLNGYFPKIEGFELLLAAGADLRTPNAQGQTPLDILSQASNYFDYVVCAFENGHDVSDMTVEYKEHWYSKETTSVPLLFGMMREAYSDERVASLLSILSKSDLTRRDDNGNTLLHTWATAFDKNERRGDEGREQLFCVLTTQIDVNARNKDGETPLVSAFKMGEYYAEYMCHGEPHSYHTTRVEFAKLLLDKMDGYGVNLADKDGMTALHYAAQNGFDNEVVALVQKGADVLAKNKDGKTPADMADNNLMKAYLQMVAKACPQRIATQPVAGQTPKNDNQNTIG